MTLTIRRQIDVALAGEEVITLALRFELGAELLGRDFGHLWLLWWLLRIWLRNMLVVTGV